MIFVSHNHKDKAVVEQVALRLRDTFGQDQVFYDSWSMQPGDGIVDKMNQGLGDCKLFLFFVSKNSLQSNMVKLEWQNAVMKAASGGTKIIPVKLDDCLMPPILMQSLYIDLFGQGLEIALRQIVDVASGNNTFTGGPQQFSNLRAYVYPDDGSYIVECHAEHYMEAISHFLFLVENEEDEVAFNYKSGSMCNTGFNKDIKLNNGSVVNAQFMAVEKGTVPGFPFILEMKPKDGVELRFRGVMHEKKQGQWGAIPVVEGRKIT
ncbi:toll/interleukin-1 receptor domain-containing protein [Photobacterium leiognathi subsp. mandapamensis]|uniref:toll/interleukin-1 receptor domain-containing protein n=1 Tax=Photobacterium leiognathi TaxID=553611 RepID=UPI000D1732D2|nr:toll/interleukin-1 receptor domain-containing protein [Photobacterium leiognathi]PSW64965.1 toll/interleukin-1 receptor domain-containing protein [Photobacterium leiognathi subsp. mandapamensis]